MTGSFFIVYYFKKVITTLLFLALPASVLLSATGSIAPFPSTN